MNRLERVREEVDAILLALVSNEDRRCGFVHLYGVSQAAAELAFARGIDPELAAVAGMLHDLSSYATGDPTDHAKHSSLLAHELLERLALFGAEDVRAIAHAIARHSDKEAVDGPFAELLKDADVLQHWLYDPAQPPHVSHAARRARLIADLGARTAPL